jgi:hypothetical protein
VLASRSKYANTAQNPPANETRPGVRWAKASYDNVDELAEILQGMHTVLSFTDPVSDPEGSSQKLLIDAAVRADVKRFAPSEWSLYAVPGDLQLGTSTYHIEGLMWNIFHGMRARARSASI